MLIYKRSGSNDQIIVYECNIQTNVGTNCRVPTLVWMCFIDDFGMK